MDLKNLKIAAVALGLGVLGSATASAAPAPGMSGVSQSSMVINTSALGSVGSAAQNLATSNVENVRWRRRHYHHHHHHHHGGRWLGPAIVAGAAALIIGGSIAQSRAGYRESSIISTAAVRAIAPPRSSAPLVAARSR